MLAAGDADPLSEELLPLSDEEVSAGLLSLLDFEESLPFLLAPFSTGGFGRP